VRKCLVLVLRVGFEFAHLLVLQSQLVVELGSQSFHLILYTNYLFLKLMNLCLLIVNLRVQLLLDLLAIVQHKRTFNHDVAYTFAFEKQFDLLGVGTRFDKLRDFESCSTDQVILFDVLVKTLNHCIDGRVGDFKVHHLTPFRVFATFLVSACAELTTIAFEQYVWILLTESLHVTS
jgi:hypothetical protein